MSGLRYLADVHISPLTCELLRREGYQVVRVTEVLPPSAGDLEILRYARQNGMVIITQDLDFSGLLALTNLPGPSVVSLRLARPEPPAVARLLLRVLPQVEGDLKEGAVISVTERKFRVRRLPFALS
ncbi:MAG: DUF5615 family PIN-like protein [Firmicutes bacterium]|nr:DUF5615 family PIN-like protein [Bacillota bacterium]